jgi:hypothetical protein
MVEPWEFALLALAAFRVWKFLADDDILEPLRDRVLALYESNPQRAGAIAGFLACPWCLGFWVAVIWWVAWLALPTVTLFLATPWALAAIVGLLASREEP